MWHGSFICVTWLSHDSFICVTWLSHISDITHPYVWYDRSTTHSNACHNSFICDMTHWYLSLTLRHLPPMHSVGWTLREGLLPPVRRRISISPMCLLLLPWQASPAGKVRSEAANPMVSRSGRLRTSLSQIPNALSVNSADASSPSSACIAFREWQASAKPLLILAEEICWTFVPRDFAVWYRSRGLVLNLEVSPTKCNAYMCDMT